MKSRKFIVTAASAWIQPGLICPVPSRAENEPLRSFTITNITFKNLLRHFTRQDDKKMLNWDTNA